MASSDDNQLTVDRSMQDLLDYEDDDLEDVFCLAFEMTYTNMYGEAGHVDLKQGGSTIPVTKENR